jgi:thermitase
VLADTTPPVVAIFNPKTGTRVSGTGGISATASDNSGTSGLKQVLTINGRQVASATGGSLSYNWNTRKVATGTHTLSVTATDAAGNRTTTSVSVTR